MENKTIFDAVKKMKEESPMCRLVAVGLISPKAEMYYNITERFTEIDKRLTRTSKCMKVNTVASEFRCAPVTVYRALNIMRQPLEKGNVKKIR
jgi:hypothetical protein